MVLTRTILVKLNYNKILNTNKLAYNFQWGNMRHFFLKNSFLWEKRKIYRI